MTQTNPKCYHLSASSISAFKACPQRFRLSYREGLRLAADTDSQRMGTNWHAIHEVYADAKAKHPDPCLEDPMTVVVEHLNKRYESRPMTKTATEWAVERTILLMSFVGYQWYFQNDPVEILASEIPFELPIHNPRLGLPLPTSEAVRVGKIDHLIRWQGMVGVLERKSTSRSIDAESDYWDKAKKDTQVSNYALACQDMDASGQLPTPVYENRGGKRAQFGSTLYDVWHKPTIKPCMLTQAETKALVETKTYHGQTFTVEMGFTQKSTSPPITIRGVFVDGEEAEVEEGKKGFAIRETVGMYGARLLADIYERPEFYYARREIARTDQDLQKFRSELYNIYQAQKMFSKNGFWFENESQCRATFPCPFIPICYGAGADAVCDGKTTPGGFKRIFVDLTVKGEALDE